VISLRILVTGAAGYVGGHLINSLLRDEKFADYEIIGIDNFAVGRRENYDLIRKDGRVALEYGDICDKEVKNFLKDVEIVYHLAAISGVAACNNHPRIAFKINVEGTLNLLEHAIKEDVEYFIYPSSAAVYGEIEAELAVEDLPLNPLNKYGAMKASCEALCKAYYNSHGLGTIILRFTNIYGVGTYPKWRTAVTNFIKRALSNENLVIHGSGEQRRDFIHIDDVVDVYKFIVRPEAKGEVFNAGSGCAASIKEVAEIVLEIARKRNKEVGIEFVNPRESKEREFGYDVSKLKSLGFENKFDLKEGIEKTFYDVERILKDGYTEFQKEL
jgi:nucleoside-diphosphate-sugar epimerase